MSLMAEGGLTTHKAPLGYVNRQRKEGNTTIKWVELDPVKSRLVRRMFTMYGKGIYSLDEIAAYMNKRGLRTVAGNKLGRSSVSYHLNSKYYRGFVRQNGVEYPGKHPALISETIFNKCQNILK